MSSNIHYQWMIFTHEWKVQAVYIRDEPMCDDDNNPYMYSDGTLITRPKTDILYVCDCGKVKIISIQGKWALEQVKVKI